MAVDEDSPLENPEPFNTGVDYGKLYLPGEDRPVYLDELVTPNDVRRHMGLPPLELDGHCHHCGNKIEVQIFKDENYCSDNCRKALGEDIK